MTIRRAVEAQAVVTARAKKIRPNKVVSMVERGECMSMKCPHQSAELHRAWPSGRTMASSSFDWIMAELSKEVEMEFAAGVCCRAPPAIVISEICSLNLDRLKGVEEATTTPPRGNVLHEIDIVGNRLKDQFKLISLCL